MKYNLFIIYDNLLTEEQKSFLEHLLRDVNFYKEQLAGRIHTHGRSLFAPEEVVSIEEFRTDNYSNYYILLPDKKGSSLKSLENQLNSMFRKLMGNARPNNPSQRSYQGKHYYKIRKIKNVDRKILERTAPLIKLIYGLPSDRHINIPTMTKSEQAYLEGRVKEYTYLHRSRNKKAREGCLTLAKGKCCVCGFNFEKTYGEIGKNFLEVHHATPIKLYEKEHVVTVDELCAVCSNCHSMIHRTKTPMDVEELKRKIQRNKRPKG